MDVYQQAIQEKDASMMTLAVCGNVFNITMFMFFNAWRVDFDSSNNLYTTKSNADGEVANGAVNIVLVTFLAGSAATLFIVIARPIVSVIFGKPDEINMQDP